MTQTINVQKNDENLSVLFEVSIPQEFVAKAFEQAYKDIRKKASIKGFRPNKAPLDVLRKMYQPHAAQQTTQDLVLKSYEDALKQSSIRPLGDPEFNIQSSAQENAKFSFTVTVDFFPSLQSVDLKQIKLTQNDVSLNTTKVTEILESLQRSASEYIPQKNSTETKSDDVLKIDFEGCNENNEPIPSTKAQDYTLELGSRHFIPGFEEKLVGVKCPSDVDFDITFPEDYNHKPLAGKKVAFHVAIKEILKKNIPELDDDLAKKFGYQDLNDCRKQVETLVKQQQEAEEQQLLENQALEVVMDSMKIPVPLRIKNKTTEGLVEDFKKNLISQKKTESEISEEIIKNKVRFEKESELIIKTSLIVSHLAQSHNIKITKQDMDQELQVQAQKAQVSIEEIKKRYSSEQINQIAFMLTRKKVADFVVSQAQISKATKN